MPKVTLSMSPSLKKRFTDACSKEGITKATLIRQHMHKVAIGQINDFPLNFYRSYHLPDFELRFSPDSEKNMEIKNEKKEYFLQTRVSDKLKVDFDSFLEERNRMENRGSKRDINNLKLTQTNVLMDRVIEFIINTEKKYGTAS